MEHTIKKSQSWSSWQEELPIATLRVNEHATAQQLFRDIQLMYQQDTSLLIHIVKFMQSTEHELIFLHRFISIKEWINAHNLGFLFPAQQESVQNAHHKIERLEYLRQVIAHYAGEYKMESKRDIKKLWQS